VLSVGAPAGGTWTARYTITDSNQGGSTVATLWQKTSPTTAANTDLLSMKMEGTNVKGMTVAEIEQIVPNFRNRIVENYGTTPAVGCYLLQAATPSETGTWTQMGDTVNDTRQEVSPDPYVGNFDQAFSGEYSQAFTGAQGYTGGYTGAFSGAYTGTYDLSYAGFTATYTGIYTGSFDQAFTGIFAGTADFTGAFTGAYTGTFSGEYTGDTIQATTEIVSNVKLWLRTA